MFWIKRLVVEVSTYTLFTKSKPLRLSVSTKMHTEKYLFIVLYDLHDKYGEQIGYILSDFFHEYGARDILTFYSAAVHIGPKNDLWTHCDGLILSITSWNKLFLKRNMMPSRKEVHQRKMSMYKIKSNYW